MRKWLNKRTLNTKKSFAKADAMAAKAESMIQQEKHREGARCYEKAISLLPDGHPRELTLYLNNAGYGFQYAGSLKKAQKLYERVLAVYEEEGLTEELVEHEPQVILMTLNSLAGVYYTLKEFKQAEFLYQQILKIDETIHDQEHPEIATDLNNLASAYLMLNKYELAEPLFKQSLAILEVVYGKEDQMTVTTMVNLADLYYKWDKYEKAEPIYKEALTLLKQIFGEGHPNIQNLIDNHNDLLEEIRKDNGE